MRKSSSDSAAPSRPAPRSELEDIGEELVELRQAELLDRLEQRIAGDLGPEVDRGAVANPESQPFHSSGLYHLPFYLSGIRDASSPGSREVHPVGPRPSRSGPAPTRPDISVFSRIANLAGDSGAPSP